MFSHNTTFLYGPFEPFIKKENHALWEGCVWLVRKCHRLGLDIRRVEYNLFKNWGTQHVRFQPYFAALVRKIGTSHTFLRVYIEDYSVFLESDNRLYQVYDGWDNESYSFKSVHCLSVRDHARLKCKLHTRSKRFELEKMWERLVLKQCAKNLMHATIALDWENLACVSFSLIE